MMTGPEDRDFVDGFLGFGRLLLLGRSPLYSHRNFLCIELEGFDKDPGKGEFNERPLFVVDKNVKRGGESDRVFLDRPICRKARDGVLPLVWKRLVRPVGRVGQESETKIVFGGDEDFLGILQFEGDLLSVGRIDLDIRECLP